MTDISQVSTEDLLKMRDSSPSNKDLSEISTEDLMKMRAAVTQQENKSADIFHALQKGAVSGLAKAAPVAAGAYMGGRLGAPFLPPWGMLAGGFIGGVAASPAGETIRDWVSNIKVGGTPITYKSINDLPPVERPIARAGEVIGGSLPFAAAPYLAARQDPSKIANIFRPIVDYARTSPGKFAAVEAVTTLGASQGAALAEIMDPGDPGSAMIGETIGGFLNPIGTAVKAGSKTLSAGKNVITSLTRAGREVKTAEILQEALVKSGEDPAAVAKILKAHDDMALQTTAGIKSESPTLLAFENRMASLSPEFDASVKSGIKASRAELGKAIENLSASADPAILETAAKLRKARFDSVIDARMNLAKKEMDTATAKLGGDKSSASTRSTEILDNALSDARRVENELWALTPKNTKLTGDGIIKAHSDLRANMLPEEPLPPSFVEEFVKRVGQDKSVTSGEAQRFRSLMLTKAREARGQKKWNEARQYSDMAEGALADISTMRDKATADALDWSRSLNDKFSRTFAGDALAVKGTGAQRIPPEAVLEKAFGSGGTMADVRFRELNAAAKFSGRGMMTDQEEFLRSAAASVIDPTSGRVSQKSLENFTAKNSELLDRFPSVRRDLGDVASAEKLFADTEAAVKTASKAVQQRAAFSRVLNYENPADAVKSALSSKTPEKDYLALAHLAERHNALDGLKSATLDYATRRATDSSGNVSFIKLNEILSTPVSRGAPSLAGTMASRGILKPDEVTRMNTILSEAEKIERGLASGARINEIPGNPDGLFDLAVRILGANVGSLAGKGAGAPIVAAGAGSKYARSIFEKVPSTRVMDVITEALKNPKFMAVLLEKPTSATHKKQLERQINAFLLQAGLVPKEEGDKQNGR